jgi:SagB-type dehydrogenase family enzyme
MQNQIWDEIRLPTPEENMAWEMFHDNSKSSCYNAITPTEVVRVRMSELLQSLNFEYCPRISLPTEFTPLRLTLAAAITNRVTARNLEPCIISLENIATIFHYAYGINRSNQDTDFPRPFRMVPSGGALYPLELFFHSTKVEGVPAGLYHYNPLQHDLAALRYGDESRKLSQSMVQNNLALDSSLLIFITAMFERSTFKYGSRGYRFTLLEAGHVAQNINLVCTAMGLGCVNIGGYYDRQIDDLLGLDGITQSTVYIIAIGRHLEEPTNA